MSDWYGGSIESPHGRPVDQPGPYADWFDELGSEEPPVPPTPEQFDLVFSYPLTDQEVRSTIRPQLNAISRSLVRDQALLAKAKSLDNFGGAQPALVVPFTLPDTTKNQTLFGRTADFGQYEALIITPAPEEEANLRAVWQTAGSDQEKRRAAYEQSKKVSKRVLTAPELKAHHDQYGKDLALRIGYISPSPSTDFKLVMVGLKQVNPAYDLLSGSPSK